MHIRKGLSLLMAVVLLLALSPFGTASAGIAVGLTLGNATLSGRTYYFSNAVVTGTNIRTLLLNFSSNVTAGDRIILPATPAVFTVAGTSNDYAKRINIASGTTADVVQAYLRGIGFQTAGGAQTVNVMVTAENILYDTYYQLYNGHYYQYVPITATTYWTAAYTAAKGMTYMGRTGYLATITSKDEDTFVNALSGGRTGWLGGTYMEHSATGSPLYYDSFTTSSVDPQGWYWACGPEKGNLFYSYYSIATAAGSNNLERAASADNANASTYFNWSRPASTSPTSDQFEPNNYSRENCLTTLNVTNSGSVIYGKMGTVFSWNNVDCNQTYTSDPTNMYIARGYFVEYGNLASGDSSARDYSYASDNGTLPVISTPQTGDGSPLSLWWGLVAITLAGIGALALTNRRKSYRM